jgi:hypothetical protein
LPLSGYEACLDISIKEQHVPDRETDINEYRSCSRWRWRNVTPLELCPLSALVVRLRRKTYENKHTLLVPLLAGRLLILTVVARQLLEYGGHGEIWLVLLLLQCWSRSQLLTEFEIFSPSASK